MKNIFVYFILAIVPLFESSCSAEPPIEIANGLAGLEVFLAKPLSTASKVDVMLIPQGIFIDPPPTTSTFPELARITVTLSGPTAYNLTKLAISDLRASSWRKSPSPRYPRWYWRMVDASGKVVIDFLIDEEGSAIFYANIWHIIDRKPVNRLTREFFDFATRQMLLPPEQR